MSIVAAMTIKALRDQGVPKLPTYEVALAAAFTAAPPPFGKRQYRDLYRVSALDPDWVALSLVTAAQSEGEGARHLWDMACSTPDVEVARQIRQHAIDESHHSRAYISLLGLIFPETADIELQRRLLSLSPGYTENSSSAPMVDSPYAYPATVDELIQMNIAEIRTRIYHLLQRPILLDDYCKEVKRPNVRQILNRLLSDETGHIAYTARLIERAAKPPYNEQIIDLMMERVKDFNAITEQEIARRTLVAV